METLTSDLVSAVVRTIGASEPGLPNDGDDLPLIRCVLWMRSGVVGFAVEDPTDVGIPRPPPAALYPAVKWDETRLSIGKATWFIMPVPSTRTHPWHPDSPSAAEGFGHA